MNRAGVGAASVAPTLEDVPGVGPTLARRIREAYGSEEAFLGACRRLDLERLLGLDGLSERRAFEIVAQLRSGQTPDLANTPRARELRRRLEDLLAGYAQTTYGKRYLRLLPVLRDAARIQDSLSAVAAARDMVERLPRDALLDALGRLSRFREPARTAPVDRLVLVESEEDEIALRGRGVDRWCRIASGAPGARLVEEYGLVVYAHREGGLDVDSAPNVVAVPFEASLAEMVPESALAFAQANRATLGAMATLGRITGKGSRADAVLTALTAGEASTGRVNVSEAAQAALLRAQDAFRARVADLSLAGAEILDLLGQGTAPALESARREAVAAGTAAFREATGVVCDPFEPRLPLRLDEEELARVENEFGGRSAVASFEKAQEAAVVVESQRGDLADELAAWFRFDVEVALGCYASDYDARPAATSNRFRVEGGLNVEVARAQNAQRIDYELGGRHRVAVLTGANSGGKSTLLEMLGQFAILHHWGLPVPAAAAQIPVLDELLVFGGSRGVDAGAFESFLRELFPPVVGPGRKLVLLDEVESMTELEAAGRILGVFLDEVAGTDSLCLLVTHLPDQVVKHARAAVRVDGIDAVGLDERFNLIVDRQPKLNHRARSTPELIVRRVHAKSQGAVKDLYAKILARWG